VRQTVIRSIASQVSPVRDEIDIQFRKHFISSAGSEIWCPVPIWATTFTMMSSIATRSLVGQPLSNDEEFTKMIGKFARGVGVESVLLRQFPKFLIPWVAKLFTTKSKVRVLKEKLRPYVMASLKETDNGQVVLQERDIPPVRTPPRT
jgi:hypothetical protein